jgi:uncharacterized protein (DUF433 family)
MDRITIDPARMAGVACIRDLRIPVATIVGLLAEGASEADILEEYPDLVSEDLVSAIEYERRFRRS